MPFQVTKMKMMFHMLKRMMWMRTFQKHWTWEDDGFRETIHACLLVCDDLWMMFDVFSAYL